MQETLLCNGISDISDSYNGFIIDQWGVLHDGTRLHPGALEVFEELNKRKKQIIIISNSGKRADPNIRRLEKLGLSRELYRDIITAGEMTWRALKDQDRPPFKDLGKKCLLFVHGDDPGTILDGLDLERVHTAKEADFILMAGTDFPRAQMADYEPYLREGVRMGLHMICANPDQQVIFDGMTGLGAGQVARRYEEFGGVVTYIGKPHAPVFKFCTDIFQDVYPGETLVIGDSLGQDVAGGANVGMDTCLVRRGIHAQAFSASEDNPAALHKRLEQLALNYGVRPTYSVQSFTWGDALPDRKHKKPRR